MIISPTIGRKVWFRPNGVVFNNKPFIIIDSKQPLDATVVYVFTDRMVNLLVIDHMGVAHIVTSCTMKQSGDVISQGCYCEWMPYQTAQAKKEADTKQ